MNPRGGRAVAAALLVTMLLACASSSAAFERFLMRELETRAIDPLWPNCSLGPNLNGSCANYRWYNLCSGYIWIYNGFTSGEGVGVRFGGTEHPCVKPQNRVKRGIYYFRNVVPDYSQTVDLYLDADCNQDGCPDFVIAKQLNYDPGLRWNCVNYGACIPCDGVVLRQVHDGGILPTFATDGPFKSDCDPAHSPSHSYYYSGADCSLWDGLSTDHDDFLMWLIVDSDPTCVTVTGATSWGAIKGLYR
jgi:hypothetical protein